MSRTILISAFAALGLLAGAASAQARTPSGADADATSFRVSTWGLDLQTSAGARAMLARIGAASSSYCGGPGVANDLQRSHDLKVCAEDNVRRAVRTLDAPMVTALAGQAASTAVADADGP